MEAIIKTDLSETKEREMAFFSCLITAMLSTPSRVMRCGKQWWGRRNAHGEDSAAARTHLTPSDILILLNIRSVAPPVPCRCEHMGKGRGSISSVKTRGGRGGETLLLWNSFQGRTK